MDYAQLKKDLEGLYITIPTLFHDEDLSINEEGYSNSSGFLRKTGSIKKTQSCWLVGLPVIFSTMSFEGKDSCCVNRN